ncbi:MAG: right-handed parallel beta-helix repeat-containing protein, partial [Solirubrobacterales bacterium]|nr:right-handed parallel beta-helix repeat-containing protein [Solirubrobacterales bacterium]
MSSTATAAAPLRCGDAITQNTTLTADLGQCTGNGLVVKANGITLNLNRYTITGNNRSAETVGVLLDNVTGVTVRNGTVTGFDAGINIDGGSGNTITAITARDNINDNIKSAKAANECTYGDGITATGSDGNTISANRVIHNGP